MEKGTLIGAGVLLFAGAAVVGFFVVMSGGDTGEVIEIERHVQQVEDVQQDGTPSEVIGKRPTERPEDPVAAQLGGTWDPKEHGQLSGDDWDEIKAITASKAHLEMQAAVDRFIAPLDVDKARVRAVFDDIQIRQEAVNVEAREGFVNPRAARKLHEEIRKDGEVKMIELLGEAKAQELRASLAAKRMVLF